MHPGGTDAEDSLVDAAAQVEDAVRRYFESGELDVASGPVRELDEAIEASGLPMPDRTVVRSLRVVSCSESEAQVALDGVQEFVVPRKRGRPKRTSVSVAGPVVARRADGQWTVVDHDVEGRSISTSFFPVGDDGVDLEGVLLRLRSVVLGRRNVVAFLEVENTSAEDVTIARVVLTAKRCTCIGGRTRDLVEAGTASQIALGWRKWLSPEMPELNVKIEARVGGTRYEMTWHVDLVSHRADARVRVPGRLRVTFRQPWVAWLGGASSVVALVALTGVPPLSFFVFLGLLLAYLLFHPLLHGLGRR
jgi:hypothetical protein